jgi:hypothetical protein
MKKAFAAEFSAKRAPADDDAEEDVKSEIG